MNGKINYQDFLWIFDLIKMLDDTKGKFFSNTKFRNKMFQKLDSATGCMYHYGEPT